MREEVNPDWKETFLRKNSEFYTKHQRTLDAWMKRVKIKDESVFPPSRRKFEWQAQDAKTLKETIMHFRPSGIRAKKPTYVPALVAITQTSIIGKQSRRLTIREAARLQGLPDWFDFYNSKVVLAFFGIEKNGLKIDKYEFDKHYELNQEFYSIQDDRIYTSYNLATTTRRPSNSFNGVNFAAINKEDGSRRSYISSHGFVEFDISIV